MELYSYRGFNVDLSLLLDDNSLHFQTFNCQRLWKLGGLLNTWGTSQNYLIVQVCYWNMIFCLKKTYLIPKCFLKVLFQLLSALHRPTITTMFSYWCFHWQTLLTVCNITVYQRKSCLVVLVIVSTLNFDHGCHHF